MVRPRHTNVVPGQHIYAYCNIKTNQVLYSLTRTLQNHQLKQLPDTGANNNPPQLRKDLWRPLWSVHLPTTEYGASQGMHAYRMLRDFRQLHETCWEPPKSMSIPYTEKQIERLQKRLDQRGGSKRENPYDLIARRKWKTRVQMVMNQKANSIADLAAVLLHQDEMVERQLMRHKTARRLEVKEMLRLAQSWLDDYGKARKELETQIQERIAQRDARQMDRRWRKLNGKVDAGQLKLARMAFAAYMVPWAKQKAEEAIIAQRIEEERIRAEKQKARGKTKTGAEEEPLKPITFLDFLPSFPPELRRKPLSVSRTQVRPSDTPNHTLPILHAAQGEGITVRWANTLDAEYAAKWPPLVQHLPMGIFNHTAPRADDENPFLEVADFKAVQWKSRREGFPLEPTLAERVQARRAAMGLQEHPTLKNKFTRMYGYEMPAQAPVEGEDVGEGQPADYAAFKAARQEQIQKLQTAALRSVAGKTRSSRSGVDAALLDGPTAASEVRV